MIRGTRRVGPSAPVLFLLLLAAPFGLVSSRPAPTAPPSGSPAGAALRRVGEEYFEFLKRDRIDLRMRLRLPVERLPDLSPAKADADARFGRSLLVRLENLDESKLSHGERLSLGVLRREARNLEQSARFYWLRSVATPYAFLFLGVHPAFSGFVFEGPADCDRYAALLARYPEFLRSVGTKLRGQAGRGIRIPKPEIPLARSLFSGTARPGEGSPFWVESERLAAIPGNRAAAFQKRVARLIAERVNPALEELTASLDGEYHAKAPEGVGLSQYPGGREAYLAFVRQSTTLDVPPEEIHRIGLEEIGRLNSALDVVMTKAKFTGSREEFRRFLATDARFLARTPDEVGQRLMAAQNRIVPRVPEFFGKVPKAPYGVARLEPELEASMTFGYYQLPTARDPRGLYKFNGSNLAERSLSGAGSLIAHELVPGHHFQFNLQLENKDLPEFRRAIGDDAFIEGWAEYASSLAGEMGMYENPYDLAARIQDDLFLTTRLVVDTGLNLLGWSRERAMEFMRANTRASEREIETETLRYSCDIPAQALAYKMGSRTIRGLRDRAERALGRAFAVRRFHDAVLSEGSLPLDLLERHVEWFIEQEKKSAGTPAVAPSTRSGGKTESVGRRG